MKVRWSEKEKEYASSLVDGNRIDILIQSSEKRNGGVVNMMYVLKKLRKINDQNQPEGEKIHT